MSDAEALYRHREAERALVEPPAPLGVWVLYPDGHRYDDLPVVFDGYDEEGCGGFEILLPRAGEHPILAGAAVIAPMTCLQLPRLGPRMEPPPPG